MLLLIMKENNQGMVHVRGLESPGLKLPFDRIFAGQKFCNCEFLFPVLIRGLDKSGRLKEIVQPPDY